MILLVLVCVCVCVRSQSIIIWELFISFLLGNVHFYNFFIMVMLFIFFYFQSMLMNVL
jgi:hypothetical protein